VSTDRALLVLASRSYDIHHSGLSETFILLSTDDFQLIIGILKMQLSVVLD
jgi:hypothetical protein